MTNRALPRCRLARWGAVLVLAASACLAAAGLSVPAHAQQPVSLAALQISLWPEFDRPSVLVILNGQLAAGVALPAKLSLRLPAAAGAPNAVAVVDANGGLVETSYNTVPAGGDIMITFSSNSTRFRVEYYDPSLVISGDARSFGLRWKTDMAIQAVTVQVQQPAGGRNLTGRPVLTAAGVGDYGLSYYTAALGPAAAGGTVAFDLGYFKSGGALSATAVAQALSQGAGAPAPTQPAPPAASGLSWLLVVLVGVPLLAVGAAVYFRFLPAGQRQIGRRRAPTQARPGNAPLTRARKTSSPPALTKGGASATADNGPAAFCPQCGRRYHAGDRFCRKCGAPVRE